MPIVQVPNEYGWVLLAATSTFFVNTFHGILTGRHRKLSGITYPAAYATNEQAAKDPKAFKFNCAQRSHVTFIESQPSMLGALLIAGLKFPVASAIFGAGWSLARIVYAIGYTSDAGPKGRRTGSIGGYICDIGLKALAVYTSIQLILNN